MPNRGGSNAMTQSDQTRSRRPRRTMAPSRRVRAGEGRLTLAALNLIVSVIYDLSEGPR
jgi:hypothetical protein